MEQDKKLFQETAQKLINYDFKHKYSYIGNQDDVKYGSKRFYAYRIVLVIIAVLYIYSFICGMRVSVVDNVFFAVLFAAFYIRHRRKMKKVKKVLDTRRNLLNNRERMEYVKVLDDLAQKHPEWQTEPWWNTISGMELGLRPFTNSCYQMEYCTFPLVIENEEGQKVVSGEMDSTVNIVSGKEINERIQSGEYKKLDLTPAAYRDEEEYHMAGLYLHHSLPEYDYYSVLKNSQDEVNAQMAEYKDKLNQKESSRNFWSESGYYETNKEKHWRRGLERDNYDYHEDIDDWFTRQRKEDKRRFELENERESIRYISSYEHNIYFVGHLIWNDRGSDQVSTILICKDKMIHSIYTTKREDLSNAHIMAERSMSDKEKFRPIPVASIISELWVMGLADMDYTVKRPEEFTADEWAAWVYVHVKDLGHGRLI